MSGREWKPGDVAITAKGEIALCHNGGKMLDQGGAPWSNDKFPDNLRPLVVIDPEDREQVERLAVGYERDPNPGETAISDMHAALRAMTQPPRPPEPTGLGAVVEDVDGDYWVYTGLRDDDDRRWWFHAGVKHKYDELTVGEIKSQGWSE